MPRQKPSQGLALQGTLLAVCLEVLTARRGDASPSAHTLDTRLVVAINVSRGLNETRAFARALAPFRS